MNILKWLKNKTGKLPVTVAQALGGTVVVTAAVFGVVSSLDPSADTNTTFMPNEQQRDVVYVAQGNGGQYTGVGGGTTRENASSFDYATPSRSILLANQSYERMQRTRSLEEADVQPSYAGETESVQMPKAYQMGVDDLGLGAGDGADKQLNGALGMLSNLQKEVPGLAGAVANAAQAGAAANAAAGQDAAAGQTAAQRANAPRNWSQGGAVHAGSGSGVNNSFAIQNSGKNGGSGKGSASTNMMAQAGNALADAQNMMNQMREGGSLTPSRANFGRSDGLGEDKDARGRGGSAYGNARGELDWIRKQSAKIAANKNNSANEAGRPFLASARISGGITVDGGTVNTGMGATSGDLSTSDSQLRGLRAGLSNIQADVDERDLARNELKQWFWQTLLMAIAAMISISFLRTIPVWGWPAAGALAAATITYIWVTGIKKITTYHHLCGGDGWTVMGWVLAALLTAGVGAALAWGPQIAREIKGLFNKAADSVTGTGTYSNTTYGTNLGPNPSITEVIDSTKPENMFGHFK